MHIDVATVSGHILMKLSMRQAKVNGLTHICSHVYDAAVPSCLRMSFDEIMFNSITLTPVSPPQPSSDEVWRWNEDLAVQMISFTKFITLDTIR